MHIRSFYKSWIQEHSTYHTFKVILHIIHSNSFYISYIWYILHIIHPRSFYISYIQINSTYHTFYIILHIYIYIISFYKWYIQDHSTNHTFNIILPIIHWIRPIGCTNVTLNWSVPVLPNPPPDWVHHAESSMNGELSIAMFDHRMVYPYFFLQASYLWEYRSIKIGI